MYRKWRGPKWSSWPLPFAGSSGLARPAVLEGINSYCRSPDLQHVASICWCISTDYLRMNYTYRQISLYDYPEKSLSLSVSSQSRAKSGAHARRRVVFPTFRNALEGFPQTSQNKWPKHRKNRSKDKIDVAWTRLRQAKTDAMKQFRYSWRTALALSSSYQIKMNMKMKMKMNMKKVMLLLLMMMTTTRRMWGCEDVMMWW